MGAPCETPDMDERVAQLLAPFAGEVCTADLLCDGHDPERVAYHLVAADGVCEALTYRELRRQSELSAAALASLGIGAGDRVATLMGKSRELLCVLIGIWRLGAVHVPLFTAFAPPAIALRLFGSGAKVVVCDASQEAKLDAGESIPADAPWQVVTTGSGERGNLSLPSLLSRELPSVARTVSSGDDPLIHIYTSGTTGEPKGVVVPVRALATFRAYGEFGYDLQAGRCVLERGGSRLGLRPVLRHSRLADDGHAQRDAGRRVRRRTDIRCPCAAWRHQFRGCADSLSLARLVRCASAFGPCPALPVERGRAAHSGHQRMGAKAFGLLVHDHYGQTEMGMFINNHHHPALRCPIKAGSMGHPMPGWCAVVLAEDRDEPAAPGEVGRVAIDLSRSPFSFFTGYHGQAEKSAEKFSADGRWYYTGDVGQVDEDGYVFFSSRDDDIIMMAGYRIGPFEVELVVSAHPDVVESAAIAVPDAIRGEVMECYVVLRSGASGSPELAAELQQWVKTRYAAHAYPRVVHFIDAMPKTPSGKIQRVVLKQRRTAELAGSA